MNARRDCPYLVLLGGAVLYFGWALLMYLLGGGK